MGRFSMTLAAVLRGDLGLRCKYLLLTLLPTLHITTLHLTIKLSGIRRILYVFDFSPYSRYIANTRENADMHCRFFEI